MTNQDGVMAKEISELVAVVMDRSSSDVDFAAAMNMLDTYPPDRVGAAMEQAVSRR